jgi:hypothetical protein
MNKENNDALNELLSTPDGRVMLSGMFGRGEGYHHALKELNDFFDKEFIYQFNEEKQREEMKCILILSKEKLKKLGWLKHFKNIEQLDQRIKLDEYKNHAEELSKWGIDVNAWIIQKLMERHDKQSKELQLKLILN